jgi:hypothetical protein
MKRAVVLSALLMLLAATVCLAQEVRYTKFNIHVADQLVRGKHEYSASYANWTDPGSGHIVIPPNTKITLSDWRRGFAFTVEDAARLPEKIGEVFFEVDTKRIRLSVGEYLDLITSTKPAPPAGLSKKDLEGVQQGKAMPGMTKAGVMTALGYPAPHETPSPDDSVWTYWQNRFRKLKVEFDNKGIVTNVIR